MVFEASESLSVWRRQHSGKASCYMDNNMDAVTLITYSVWTIHGVDSTSDYWVFYSRSKAQYAKHRLPFWTL